MKCYKIRSKSSPHYVVSISRKSHNWENMGRARLRDHIKSSLIWGCCWRLLFPSIARGRRRRFPRIPSGRKCMCVSQSKTLDKRMDVLSLWNYIYNFTFQAASSLKTVKITTTCMQPLCTPWRACSCFVKSLLHLPLQVTLTFVSYWNWHEMFCLQVNSYIYTGHLFSSI